MDFDQMPMPKADKYDHVIAELSAEHVRPAEVWRQFQQTAVERGWTDHPSERTVKRRVLELRQRLPKQVHDDQRRLRWPACMIDQSLPWEASRSVLDLLLYRRVLKLGRPSVSEARWYWRFTLASPSLKVEQGSVFASIAASDEFLSRTLAGYTPVFDESYEWLIAFQPWKDQEMSELYEWAPVFDEKDPIPLVRYVDDGDEAAPGAFERGMEAIKSEVRERIKRAREERTGAKSTARVEGESRTHG